MGVFISMRKLLKESGIRNIKELAKRYPKAKIYFHQDLDGVTTAIGMKNYLEQNGIQVVDAEIIQYGDKEFSVKKIDAEGDTMPVLVDFAHGKPMFIIHTDHHDTQAGVEQGTSTSFREARSNVETISQVVSPKEIFPFDDITLISTVDSANYIPNKITVDMVMNYLYKFDKDSSLKQNKMMMGLMVNKLLLAFKNKPKFMETLVLDAKPSLISILNVIRREIKDKGYASQTQLDANQKDYVEKMKTYPNLRVDGNIIVQYGGGSMFKPGSYDRFTPFKNNPDADFIVLGWPLGLVQASCNPFKEDRALKGINLGEVKNEVLSKWESGLKSKGVSLNTIKRISETAAGEESVGFTFKDFMAIYGNSFKKEGGEDVARELEIAMDTKYSNLSYEQKQMLRNLKVSAWDIIMANSGGHKCITNISGLVYLGKEERSEPGKEAPYVTFTKMVMNEFVRVLKSKMENQ